MKGTTLFPSSHSLTNHQRKLYSASSKLNLLQKFKMGADYLYAALEKSIELPDRHVLVHGRELGNFGDISQVFMFAKILEGFQATFELETLIQLNTKTQQECMAVFADLMQRYATKFITSDLRTYTEELKMLTTSKCLIGASAGLSQLDRFEHRIFRETGFRLHADAKEGKELTMGLHSTDVGITIPTIVARPLSELKSPLLKGVLTPQTKLYNIYVRDWLSFITAVHTISQIEKDNSADIVIMTSFSTSLTKLFNREEQIKENHKTVRAVKCKHQLLDLIRLKAAGITEISIIKEERKPLIVKMKQAIDKIAVYQGMLNGSEPLPEKLKPIFEIYKIQLDAAIASLAVEMTSLADIALALKLAKYVEIKTLEKKLRGENNPEIVKSIELELKTIYLAENSKDKSTFFSKESDLLKKIKAEEDSVRRTQLQAELEELKQGQLDTQLKNKIMQMLNAIFKDIPEGDEEIKQYKFKLMNTLAETLVYVTMGEIDMRFNEAKEQQVKQETDAAMHLAGKPAKKLKLVHSNLAKTDMEIIQQHAENFFGCTGDMSFSECVALGKIPFYDVPEHKKTFFNDMIAFTDQHQLSTLSQFFNLILQMFTQANAFSLKYKPAKTGGWWGTEPTFDIDDPESYSKYVLNDDKFLPELLKFSDAFTKIYADPKLHLEAKQFSTLIQQEFNVADRIYAAAIRGLIHSNYPSLVMKEKEIFAALETKVKKNGIDFASDPDKLLETNNKDLKDALSVLHGEITKTAKFKNQAQPAINNPGPR